MLVVRMVSQTGFLVFLILFRAIASLKRDGDTLNKVHDECVYVMRQGFS